MMSGCPGSQPARGTPTRRSRSRVQHDRQAFGTAQRADAARGRKRSLSACANSMRPAPPCRAAENAPHRSGYERHEWYTHVRDAEFRDSRIRRPLTSVHDRCGDQESSESAGNRTARALDHSTPCSSAWPSRCDLGPCARRWFALAADTRRDRAGIRGTDRLTLERGAHRCLPSVQHWWMACARWDRDPATPRRFAAAITTAPQSPDLFFGERFVFPASSPRALRRARPFPKRDTHVRAVASRFSIRQSFRRRPRAPIARDTSRPAPHAAPLLPAASATTRNSSGCASTTASALWPIEPVDPRMAMPFMSATSYQLPVSSFQFPVSSFQFRLPASSHATNLTNT